MKTLHNYRYHIVFDLLLMSGVVLLYIVGFSQMLFITLIVFLLCVIQRSVIGLGDIEPMTLRLFSPPASLSPFKQFLGYNHAYLFPILLVIYLSLQLIQQTNVFDLSHSFWFQRIDSDFLLFVLIVSALATIGGNDQMASESKAYTSIRLSYGFLLLAALLSMLACYILWNQLQDLGGIGYVLVVLCSVLVWFVGIMVLQEE